MKHDNDYTIGLRNIWEVVCYGSDGQEKWREINKNLVTTAGADHVLDGTFKSGTQIKASSHLQQGRKMRLYQKRLSLL